MAFQQKREGLGIMSLLSAAFIYSFFGILTRIIGFAIPVFFAGIVRNVLGCIFLGAIVLFGKKWISVSRKDLFIIALRSLCGLVGFIGSYYSFYYLPIGTAYFIFYGVVAVAGFIVGSIFFKEKVTSAKIAALLLAVIGLAIMYVQRMQTGSIFYMIFAAVSGVGTALWNSVSKFVSDKYSGVQLNFLDYVFSLILFTSVSLILKEQWVFSMPLPIWLANLLFVFMFISTGQLMIYGFKHLESQVASIIMLSEVVFGVVLAYFFYHEVLSVSTILGGCIIFVGFILPELFRSSQK